MGKTTTADIRNVSLISHGGAGKTSLTEAILFDAGSIERLGRVDDGSTTSDYDPEEIKRHISLTSTITHFNWKDHKVNLIDNPGYADFIGEVKGSLRACDGAILLIDAVNGFEPQAETYWKMAGDENLSRLVFINKMDKENADFDKALASLRASLKGSLMQLQIPIGSGKDFKGVIDLVKEESLISDKGKMTKGPVPGDMQEKVAEARRILMEAAAENDEELLDKYLSEESLSGDEMLLGLAKGVKEGGLALVLCGSALFNQAVEPLMDAIVNFVPSPNERPTPAAFEGRDKKEVACDADPSAPLVALVFKTISDPYIGRLNFARIYSGTMRASSTVNNSTQDKKEKIGHLFAMCGKEQGDVSETICGDIVAIPKLAQTHSNDTLCDESKDIVLEKIDFPTPVYSVAIESKTKGDDEKLSTALSKLAEEDPTFVIRRDNETSQTVISAMGNVQIEVKMDKLNHKYGVQAELKEKKIAYKETIRKSARVQGKYKKQSGGRGQYGDVWVEFQPLAQGSGFEFENKIFGGSVPKQYIPAVEKGLREAMAEGVLAGHEAVDIKATLHDGSFHPVDSSEMAFKIAASMAFKKGVAEASPVLLEPILNVEVLVPEAYMGNVIGDLNSKRGRILGMEPTEDGFELVRASVPEAEMKRYATELRSLAHGRGSFSFEFARYEEVPKDLADRIVEEI
ncbi:MAG: elongation factor G [Actinomycetota bacterium]|nr:elongation factor G [Actinomycetota bacterium]